MPGFHPARIGVEASQRQKDVGSTASFLDKFAARRCIEILPGFDSATRQFENKIFHGWSELPNKR